MQFRFDAYGRMKAIVNPAGQETLFDYGGATAFSTDGRFRLNALTSVTYPDGSNKAYHYNEAQHTTSGSNPLNALTGITDELGVRYVTFGYLDSQAVRTEHAGGVGKYSFAYSGSSTYVTDPLGIQSLVYNTNVRGILHNAGSSQPAGSGSVAGSKSLTYDANGNLASANDFNGKRICYANDLTRNLETSRVEGLAGGTNCPTVTGSGATLPAGSRKISSQWHPDWRLQAKVAEPGRITTYVYNGQPDPLAGGAVASCAPAGALLPDGKPIAVLCRQVEQATTDANGAAGFSATLDGTVANREQRWSYNQWGQVLTHDGPRTDIADITTYTYYSDTSFTGTGAAAVGHTTGDLQSVSNAAGQLTQYTQYDKHGNVIQSIDPNGIITTNSYDLRQRLLSTSVGGQTTSYSYDLAGQLKRVTRPDASWIGYDYDPAHRQTAVYDNLGNRIEYLLDNAGNRIAETVKDNSGALRRQLARSIDALGRVQQTTGRN
ncbi:RHS repeat protein [Piscinibacter sp.]|uniref:RHS repeat protein n=1 Tax=Piscinibacter sp. TaxID=1903157 RepID=UPI0039E3EED6